MILLLCYGFKEKNNFFYIIPFHVKKQNEYLTNARGYDSDFIFMNIHGFSYIIGWNIYNEQYNEIRDDFV